MISVRNDCQGSDKVDSPPARDVNPTEGLIPTKLFVPLGPMMEPSVSLPKAQAANPMELETPLPELDPAGVPRGTYALEHWPPLPEKPAGTPFPR